MFGWEDEGPCNEKKNSIYSEEIMDELVDKMVEFLKNHKTYKLMELVTSAVATKEKEKTHILQCNHCKHYEGVHNVAGHAPCSFWNIGAVLYNDFCSRFEKWKE